MGEISHGMMMRETCQKKLTIRNGRVMKRPILLLELYSQAAADEPISRIMLVLGFRKSGCFKTQKLKLLSWMPLFMNESKGQEASHGWFRMHACMR